MAKFAECTTFILPAKIFIRDRKQADQPVANNCSGLVPLPGAPGVGSLMSRRPSEVREAPTSQPLWRELWPGTRTLPNWFMAGSSANPRFVRIPSLLAIKPDQSGRNNWTKVSVILWYQSTQRAALDG